MPERNEVVDILAGLTLFADLSRPQLEAVAHTFDEDFFPEGQRVLRQGFAGSGFYVIVEGDAAVRVNGEDLARLSRGDFFGEISVLLGEPPTADVIALVPLRCLVLPGTQLEGFLVDHPRIAFRMVQTLARRLRSTIQWRS
jgi:CRP/FNR family transcriptional regulator, cyclic AMP receptor protein